ncbi:MAG TPA: glycosyltransferase family 39 protein [Bryobacteraceae bacterium]|nr:glycosyltransferase family 39 protein [Bryobacteraceae bacterium]
MQSVSPDVSQSTSSRGVARRHTLIVLLIAVVIYLGCIVSPPGLMDDVDAVQGQIARTMVETGDWVTPHLNGIAYLEKPPFKYWLMAICFMIFGVHDWVARLPLALSVVGLCFLTLQMGRWAFSERAGYLAAVVLSTCVGLFLFTRIQISDAMLAASIALATWGLLRCLDADEPRPHLWSAVMAASIGVGILLKGLLGAVVPLGGGVLWLVITGQFFRRETWARIRPVRGTLLVLLIAAPWHIAAMVRNPPLFDFTMKSEGGVYHGFFWFYFLNEHLFRFLNIRYPRDYNTVPRHLFWLYHLLWFFPWSVYLPAVWRLRFLGPDRASRTKLLMLCSALFLMVFFTFSTTQEYYSLPAYPAVALLLGCAIAEERWVRSATRVLCFIALAAAGAIAFLLSQVWNLPAPGDISNALVTQDPNAYTLSLAHMGDLTIQSFAYLKVPLMLAGLAFLIGVAGTWKYQGERTWLSVAAMMVLFFHAARLALVVFDPYLGSKALAEALLRAPEGKLIVDDQYYKFSSVFFYTNRRALLLNGRVTNLEYGSHAPGAPNVFINDSEFAEIWRRPERQYLLVEKPAVPRIESLVGKDELKLVASSGGKFLYTNADLR